MQYRMLGPVEIWDGDRRVELGKAESAKARCVLAALLRDPGELITSETLGERVWGDDPPGAAVRYKYVGWIRAALAPYGVQLIFRDNGYVLPVDPDEVDLHRFRRLASRARNAYSAGRHEEAASALRDALGLWHGPALAGLSGRWAELFRAQLTEERVSAMVLRVRADLELGRHTEVIPELAGLQTERPADEIVARLLMLALYQSGQRAQALAAYHRADLHIRKALDTHPSPELQDLRRRIQAGDPGLLPGGVIIDGPDARADDEPAREQRPLRVVIADESAVLRDGMAWLLTTRGHHVVAAVTDADALMAAVEQHKPDAAIVDVRLAAAHAGEGLHAAVSLHKEYPGLGVLVFSQYIDTLFATELLADQTGGLGYLLKDRVADVSEFISALTRVANGGTALDPEVVARLLTASRHGGELAALTRGERDVLALLAEGLPDGAIAQKLAIPASAVEKQVKAVFRKLGLPLSADRDRRILAVLRYLRS
jgi:DNA-binding NarL/FixJ family response regulator/DNA-binding SARP family transcriptional activator